ncbi:MAG TPA: hypothetical protein VF146_11495 [Bryobacteraceae bacterium]
MEPTLSRQFDTPDEIASHRAVINRENSQRSTGPRSQDGKQRSSQNALKHGLTSRMPVLRSEDPALYEQRCRQFHDEYQPKTPTEIQLVQELADTAWRLNRIPRLEAELLDIADRDLRRNGRLPSAIAAATRALATLGLHAQRLSRQFNKTLTTLRDIQAQRRAGEHQASAGSQLHAAEGHGDESGFVFSNQPCQAQHSYPMSSPAHSDAASLRAVANASSLAGHSTDLALGLP